VVRIQGNGRKVIWGIGGGKGGTGKSFVTANIGVSLAASGVRVILIDADLGGANLHTILGVSSPAVTLSDFIQKRVSHLQDVLIPTPVPNLQLLTGSQGLLNAADTKGLQRRKILKSIRSLEGDYILVDLGAGNAMSVLDFFLMSDGGILIVTPEPTSVENAYRFLRSAFYRRLRQSIPLPLVRALIDGAMDAKNEMGLQNPHDLIDAVKEVSEEAGRRLTEEIEAFQPNLILNQVRTEKDVDIGFSMRSASKKYFGIQLHYLGYVVYDQEVNLSIRKRRPLVLENPHSKAARCVSEIASRLAHSRQLGFGSS
jgi:flagellar biosynthesis protein FlhG